MKNYPLIILDIRRGGWSTWN